MSELTPGVSPKRPLSDDLIQAFYHACELSQGAAASHIIKAIESVYQHEEGTVAKNPQHLLEELTELRMHLMLTSVAEPAREPHLKDGRLTASD